MRIIDKSGEVSQPAGLALDFCSQFAYLQWDG